VNYLISKGVNTSTLRFKGYGPKLPIAENSSAEGKSKNRRTEFKIISTE
jgi:outer membrane protein OmpA-like peptidoglycan-associated protein